MGGQRLLRLQMPRIIFVAGSMLPKPARLFCRALLMMAAVQL